MIKRLTPLLRISAVVLIAFALAATAHTTLQFLGVAWTSWLCAAIGAWFVGHVLDEAAA